jgi:hypothetical protein
MEDFKNDKVTISILKLIELESEAVYTAIANKDNPLSEESIRAIAQRFANARNEERDSEEGSH